MTRQVVHFAFKSDMFARCGEFLNRRKVAVRWKSVTCKRCLKKRKAKS